MTTKRKSRRSRNAARLPEPTERQLFEAMLAFNTLKMRYRLEKLPHAPPGLQFVVRVVPEMVLSAEQPIEPSQAFSVHSFRTEADARMWREHEIIRETVRAAMRTKP